MNVYNIISVESEAYKSRVDFPEGKWKRGKGKKIVFLGRKLRKSALYSVYTLAEITNTFSNWNLPYDFIVPWLSVCKHSYVIHGKTVVLCEKKLRFV